MGHPNRDRHTKLAVLWTLPAAVLVIAPLAYVVVRASDAPAQRWAELVSGTAGAALWRTLLLAGLVGAGAVVLGGGLALACSRMTPRTGAVAVALLAIPLAIPSYVGAVVYRGLLGPVGSGREALAGVGIERLPELDGFTGALVVLILFTYPYPFLLARAALARADPSLEQAARGLGHRPGAVFLRLTVPLLRPALAAGFAMSALYVVQDFGVVSIMRCTTLTRLVYIQYTSLFDRNGAAVTALLLVLAAAALLVAAARLAGPVRPLTGRRERSIPRPAGSRLRRAAGIAFVTIIGLAAAVIPVATLVGWALAGVQGPGTTVAEATRAAGWSLGTATVAGLVALAVTLPIAWLRVRLGGPAGAAATAITRVGFALPGIVVALGFVALSLAAVPVAYQTLPLLIAAYVARFLTQAADAQADGLARVPEQAEQAARGLGVGRVATLRRVTLPLMVPGMAAGWALVFVSTMKELPATIILRPTGMDTLASEIWTKSQVAAYSEAAIPALIMVAVTALPLWWVSARAPGRHLRQRPGG